jgi:hypothetical protein
MTYQIGLNYSPTSCAPATFRRTPHAALGIAVGLVALFEGPATVFGVVTGFVIAEKERDRIVGRRPSPIARLMSIAAILGGLAGIVVFGSTLGLPVGLLLALAVAVFERGSATASRADRRSAAIVVLAGGTVVYALASTHINKV